MADFHSTKNLKDPCSCPIGLHCKYTAGAEQILGVVWKNKKIVHENLKLAVRSRFNQYLTSHHSAWHSHRTSGPDNRENPNMTLTIRFKVLRFSFMTGISQNWYRVLPGGQRSQSELAHVQMLQLKHTSAGKVLPRVWVGVNVCIKRSVHNERQVCKTLKQNTLLPAALNMWHTTFSLPWQSIHVLCQSWCSQDDELQKYLEYFILASKCLCYGCT